MRINGLRYRGYDTGNVKITVDGSTKTALYGQSSTPSTIAADLANQINNDGNFPVSAGLSGATVTLTARQAGAGTNYSLSVSSATDDVPDFGVPSFSAAQSGATLTGGLDGTPEGSPTLSRPIVTTYEYDVLDNLTSASVAAMGPVNGVTYADQPRSYVYDSISRVTSVTTPESGTVTNYYTDVNNQACAGDPSLPCRVQDARGVMKTLSYDNINRPLGVTYSDGTPPVGYSYVAGVDRLASITEGPTTPTPVNSQTFAYDNLGRITSVTQSIDQVNYVIQYTYNLLGQLATITYPSTRVVSQNYDSVGRMASIADGTNTYLSGLSYNAAGETLGLTMGNGVQGAFTYNDHLQLASLRYFKTGLTPDPLNLGYDYTSTAQLNNNGQIQAMHYYTQPSVEDQTKSESFTYDAWSRLKAAQTINVNSNTPGTWSLAWTYDRLGNRKQQTLTGGNLPGGIGQPNFTMDESTNRINGFSYDPAGNLTGDGVFTYAYDGANRMKQAQQVASPNTITSSTYFGPLRIKKVVGSTTTRYLYSGSKAIAEYVNGSTTPSKEYIYAGSTLLATVAGTSTTYHHPDHLSNRAETDGTGAVVRTSGSFPYGESWYESSADPMKFTTYMRDNGTGETGLDYAMFRQYNPGAGRFMSADLLAGHMTAPQTLNKFVYANDDPINTIDPLGLDGTMMCMNDMARWSFDKGKTWTAWYPLGSVTCLGGIGGGGVIAPVPVPGGPDDKKPKVDIDDLRKRLLDALLSDPNCMTFLGGRVGGALGLLEKIPIDIKNVGSVGIQAITDLKLDPSVDRPINPQIHINENGMFSIRGMASFVGGVVIKTGTPLFQALTMFHELGHAAGMLPDDSHSADQSQKNSETIMEKCKKALSNFANK